MKCEFLHKEGSSRLILIFSGWSTDMEFYSHISHPGWDVAVVSGYTDFDFPTEILDSYTTISLFAWSMGVYMASMSVPFNRLSMAIAINGTESPVDNSTGIPENIFKGTLETLDERNLRKFRMRMSGSHYKNLEGCFNTPDIDKLKSELEFILKSRASAPRGNNSKWNRVYISRNDLIFPFQNQKQAWKSHNSSESIIEIDAPHYVDLLPLIKSALPSSEKIGKRFSKALATYNQQADSQRTIAHRLAEMCEGTSLRRVIEIGPGSGIFTHAFASRHNPESIDFVDLYRLPVFGVAQSEHYHIANAEDWMAHKAEQSQGQYDAIVSASALQWFVNPKEFFHNSLLLLKPGGILACSTFLPGNLEEISSANPYGIIYRSKDEIEEMLSSFFDSFSLEEESITLEFESPRDTLLHLKHTGVGGSSSSGLSLKELLGRLPSRLTYRPLYIIARKQLSR